MDRTEGDYEEMTVDKLHPLEYGITGEGVGAGIKYAGCVVERNFLCALKRLEAVGSVPLSTPLLSLALGDRCCVGRWQSQAIVAS